MRHVVRCRTHILVAALATGISCAAANAAVTLLGVQYQPDQAFPEHECFWHEPQFPGPCSASLLGANVHVYLRNTGGSPVTVNDVTLAGLSLKDNLVEQEQVVKRHPYSIWWAPPGVIPTLVNAGEPVWYKADPAPIPAGGTAQVVVRLRSVPVTQPVSIGVVTSVGTVNTTIPVEANAPQLASVGFSADLMKVSLYWRRSGGTAPTTILMDGTDVTAITTTASDPAVGIAASLIQLSQPLSAMSYHVFKGTYADGKTATGGLRAWVNKFIYGQWSAMPSVPEDDSNAAKATIDDATNRGVNAMVVQGETSINHLVGTVSGRQYVADHGYGFVSDEVGKWSCTNPLMWFIRDEPDCADSRLNNLDGDKKVGALAMSCVERGEELRGNYTGAPTTLNLDMTYKPYNWYNYGQVADVMMSDPYYQARMREAYWSAPLMIPLYNKATYVYACTQLAQSSSEPNPLHIILYSCEQEQSGSVFPFPTPQSKRIEVYYALAGGAKGFSYWWFKPTGGNSNGLGDGGPEAMALWREIGLLGNEIKTAAPLLVTSCPTTLTVQSNPNPGLWVRSLLVGTDTIILLVVNDTYINDEDGCHYSPVDNASLTVSLPTWLTSPSAFEISACGIGDVSTQVNGNQLQVTLGTVDLTRMIVVTSSAQWRTTIEQRYDQQVRAGVLAFASDACSSIPPVITQHPQSHTICAGTTTTFTVAATGAAPLAYQWQKNSTNLTNGGHYAGCMTTTLTISNASTADAANYRCVVSNAHGSVNSNQAALTVIACNPNCLTNLGFEGGFNNDVGIGWTKFIKAGSEGPNLSFADETTEKHSGSHCQEIYSHDVGYDGGVYQQFVATPGQPYTLKAWFKTYSPQGDGIAEGFLGMDPYGGTDPNSINVIWVSKPYNYWSQKIWTVTAQGNFITVYLRGHSVKPSGQNKVAYVWIDDVSLSPGSPTDSTPQALSATSIRWRWTDLASETGYRVRDGAGADKSGLLAADTSQWLEATGIVPNTQYTRRICAINDCGESDPSTGQTAYSLIETPSDVALGTITANSIVATAVGTVSNLTTGSSGVRVSNTIASTDSGWQTSLAPWASADLTANTPYDFVARGRNADGVETIDCDPETAWTLSAPPTADNVTPDKPCATVNASIVWTAVGGFGAGTIEYYLYAWDQSPTNIWTGLEPLWLSGTLATSPTATGSWYLHVQGYNGDDIANGTHDYAVTAGVPVATDYDNDCDVDQADFNLFKACLSGSDIPYIGGCGSKNLDGDGDVDLSDFGLFQRCFSGENNPANPNCAN